MDGTISSKIFISIVTNQYQLCVNGTVVTDNCDHERHEGATKNLASTKINQARPKRKDYCLSCGSNYTHRCKAYYKKTMGGSEKGCQWRLGEIFNKIEISKPKISLINYIDTLIEQLEKGR